VTLLFGEKKENVVLGPKSESEAWFVVENKEKEMVSSIEDRSGASKG